MKKAIANITDWINDFTGLLQTLVVFGIVVGILFDDPFGLFII